MKRNSINLLSVLAVAVLSLLVLPLQAEQIPDPETDSTVPELVEFHEVIYQIWHNAYPAKDYQALRNFLGEIEAGAARIKTAELPGILRDKKEAWEKALNEFESSVDLFRDAVRGSDDQKLLDAAEMLHMRYEMMVRAIRPVLREIDAFHKVLYVIYHRLLPEKKLAEICVLVPELLEKAGAIKGAVLPKRLEKETESFRIASGRLLDAVRSLAEGCKSSADDELVNLVEKLHAAYQSMEQLFD